VRFAYADPPYPGQARRHYGQHEDFDGEVDHYALIERLEGFDAWALSTGSRMLCDVLRIVDCNVEQDDIRLLAWFKPLAPPMGDGFMYSWEPIITAGGRRPLRPIRDFLVASPEGYTFRARPEEVVIGSKPPAFSRWLFECMGLRPDDEFHDLFPGSGAVTREWERWTAQSDLFQERAA
jgi:hypothetical protein